MPLQRGARFCQKQLALSRQQNAPANAIKQPDTVEILKFPDGAGNGGWCEMQRLGSARQVRSRSATSTKIVSCSNVIIRKTFHTIERNVNYYSMEGDI